MARWRAEALRRLPELRKTIAAANNVMALWIELTCAFEMAYKADPVDESLISRIYAYADWCIQAPHASDAGRDPTSAVTVAFYEHIPTFPPARDDMPRWFHASEIAQNRQVFSYLISDTEYADLLQYVRKNQRLYRPRTE